MTKRPIRGRRAPFCNGPPRRCRSGCGLAKLRLWAVKPTVVAVPAGKPLPGFKSRKFASHAELNACKAARLRQLAQSLPGT